MSLLPSLSAPSSLSSYTNLLSTTEKIEKNIQKNNVQNNVKKEYIGTYKENEVSNANNNTKTDRNKKDQNGNKEVKSVVIIGDIMIKI